MNCLSTNPFFVPDLATEEGKKARAQRWEAIVCETFDIAYAMKQPFSEIDQLAIFERKYIYNRLADTLKERQESLEKLGKSQGNQKVTSVRGGKIEG